MTSRDNVLISLQASRIRKLRPGEIAALTSIYETLQRQVSSLRDALRARVSDAQAPDHVELTLRQGYLEVRFPGAHSIRLPSGLTQHDRAAAMDLLVTLLRERGEAQSRRVGGPAAPLQSAIPELLAKARSHTPRVIPPSHKSKPSMEQLDGLLGDLKL